MKNNKCEMCYGGIVMDTNMETSESLFENTVSSLKYGIEHMDGVELDLRMCSDKQLVLHHDTSLMVDNPEKNGFNKWTENNSSDVMKEIGFHTLDDLFSENDFLNMWHDFGKLVCFEMKLPHPRSGLAGGWKRGANAFNYAKEMYSLLEDKISETGMQGSSKIIFSFYPKISNVADSINSNIQTATLEPHVRQWGNSIIQKLVALPGFASSTLFSLARNAKRRNSPIIGCGLEYFLFPTNMVRFGRSVSLKGYGLNRLKKARAGLPIFVWPTPLEIEKSMINAGITCISDNVGSNYTTLPTGEIRWQRIATQPVTPEYKKIFLESEKEEHSSLIKEAENDLPMWVELNKSEKVAQLDVWKKEGYWGNESKSILEKLNENAIPWQIPRMIAHRGAGITGRPNGWWKK